MLNRKKIYDAICTSCGACYVVCPQKCIAMSKNSLSQPIPKVDKKRCTNCGLCVKTCPQLTPITGNYPMECYVAWSRDESDYITSASGGVGAVIARHQVKTLEKVYGCEYTDTADLRHFSLVSEKDIESSKSSKYSQSNSYGSYDEINRFLSEGKKVVFIGTPCQCAGLLRTVKKGQDNLITVDLVCHGTPPNEYLKKHLYEEGVKFPISKIRFRGEFDQMVTVWVGEEIVYQRDRFDDLYFAAFYQNTISCNSCYNCRYACAERVSDITIGDFWGLGDLKEIKKMSKRPSLVLINTQKGKEYFNNISSELFYEQRAVEEGINGNGRLQKPHGENFRAKLFQLMYKCRIFGFNYSLRIVNYLFRKRRYFLSDT